MSELQIPAATCWQAERRVRERKMIDESAGEGWKAGGGGGGSRISHASLVVWLP